LCRAVVARSPFIAPVCSKPRDLLEILVELDSEYATSSVRSWLMFPTPAKMLVNQRDSSRFSHILRRKNFHNSWADTAPRSSNPAERS